MNKKQVIDILVILNSYYGKKFEYPKEEDKLTDVMENTWYKFLKDYPYKVVEVATERLMVKKEWSPTPGEIIGEINRLQESDEDRLTAGEAWELVNNAISEYGYTYNPTKVKEALPNKVLHVAETVGLDLIAKKGKDTYVMNLFIRNFNCIEEKQNQSVKLPPSMKAETDSLIDEFKTPQIEEDLSDDK